MVNLFSNIGLIQLVLHLFFDFPKLIKIRKDSKQRILECFIENDRRDQLFLIQKYEMRDHQIQKKNVSSGVNNLDFFNV